MEITKKVIIDSFKELASKKNVSDITVKEITDKCGLKRQTFYNHFKDKYDLIKWIYLNEVILKIENDDDWTNCEAQNYLIHFILRQSKPIIEKVINEKSKNTNIKEEDKDFLCLFYSGALGALIINWIELGMHDDIDTLVNKVKILLDGNINNYINMTKCGKCQR